VRILVLSGGGAHGAFEVGVIKRLAELGRSWDAIVGVSAGAINALCMAMYPQDQVLDGARALELFWDGIKGNDSVYKMWPLGYVEAVLGRGALYDTTPLADLLRAQFRPDKLASSGVELRLGAVALGTGAVGFGPKSGEDPVTWTLASAAFPGAFPPVEIDGDRWVDGGVRQDAPIAEAIAMGATELDVVLAETHDDGGLKHWDTSGTGNAVLVGLRAADLLANQVLLSNSFPLISFKGVSHVYAPYAAWDTDPLSFDPAAIRHMIDVGYGIP
jgi:NTE family protein